MKKAVIRNGKIIYGDDIEANSVKPNDQQAKANREAMKINNRKDLLQPSQTDFYKAYKNKLDDLPDEAKRLLS